ncbi:MAG TPA: Hint domain-containing protein, partial [archaeon]|nr:Hint domain-containing protein [archaeon]
MELKDLNTAEVPDWCPGCVLPGTLIHKNPSIEKVELIKVGDKVLGSDGKYHKVTEVFKHKHKGKMFRIKSKSLGECVLTDEHPVLSVERKNAKLHNKEFELKWRRADSLKKGDYLAYPIPSQVEDLQEIELPIQKKEMDRKSFEIPKKIKLNEDFLRLAGYYLSEGHVHKREIIFTFNINEMDFAEDVIKITERIFNLKAT